jgi:sugar phosphate isomerase/epimerase
MTPKVLASTTSHKGEALLPALEVFSRLDLCDVDLNLHHVMELGVALEDIRRSVDHWGLRLWVVSGGWCDFFRSSQDVEPTFRSVERQVGIATSLGVAMLRLFFGRLTYETYSTAYRDIVCDNLRRLSDQHPNMLFVFENHDGASVHPEVCAQILERVGRENIRMNFDPINFERAGVDSLTAIRIVQPFVGHVHLKGLEGGEFCEFGVGDVDLRPVLSMLVSSGYRGRFTVEYEGRADKTLRLLESVRRARKVLAELGIES